MNTERHRHLLSLPGLLAGVVLFTLPALALTDPSPYSAISGRNAFALRPPPVVTNTPLVTPNPAPGIELQGFTTILGRPQVLLKMKIAPKPPEPAKDKSCVLDIGQIEGDIEIVSIDAYAGTVNLKNQGNLVSLNLQENGAKPTQGPPISAPSIAKPPGFPGQPTLPGVIPPAPNASAPGVTTVGNPGTMPTRNLRSGNAIGALGTAGAGNQPPRELSAEEGAALLEINRKANEGKGLPFPPPRFKLDE